MQGYQQVYQWNVRRRVGSSTLDLDENDAGEFCSSIQDWAVHAVLKSAALSFILLGRTIAPPEALGPEAES
jgi:hypothetical protein